MIHKRFPKLLGSLAAQMILSSIVLVLLTALSVGLPALLLVRSQIESQAWAQLEQGTQAANALYQAQEQELAALAALAAQRPTLQSLAQSGRPAEIEAYLEPLRENANLDLLLFCSLQGELIAPAGAPDLASFCQFTLAAGAVVGHQVWIVASAPINSAAGQIIAGRVLDDGFAKQMHAHTGLHHTVLVDRQPVASSLAGRHDLTETPAGVSGRYMVNGQPVYFSRFEPGTPGVTIELSLPVGELLASRQQLEWLAIGGLVLVVGAASVLGIILARRIGRPLADLAQSAARLSQQPGTDETPPVASIETPVREVAMLAQALESARTDLEDTLLELRHEKLWTDQLLEAIVEGIITLDRHGRINFFSRGAERITGWMRDKVTGVVCDQVFQPIESNEPFSQLIPGPGQQSKVAVMLRNDRQAVLAISGARLLPNGNSDDRVALVFRDVTEEEAMHRLMANFLANVSHEFRTPLSALAASVELLLDQAPDLSPQEMQELLTNLHLGVLGLQTLIDNLLESTSIEAGRFRVTPRPADLGEIIAESVRLMQPLLEKRGQYLSVELSESLPPVLADFRRLVQVLVNLISNASKYGPDHSEIRLSAAPVVSMIRVEVSDHGSGIPPEHRADLFRRFTRLTGGDHKAQYGAGLGLSVVKAIVEAHGGEVGIDDRPGGGAVFWFTLAPAVGSES